jgi:hypothetical protein
MTTRHLFVLGAAILLVCASCAPATSTSADPSARVDKTYCRETVEAIAALHGVDSPSLDFLRGLKDGTEQGFDANEYLDVLSHLSLPEGYTLGYLYYLDEGFGGMPRLHARPSQYDTLAEYIEAEQPDLPKNHLYADFIRTDGAVRGFFEFVVLRIMGEQFYLYWHAADNDDQILCDRAALFSLVNEHPRLPAGVKIRARTLVVAPVVKVGEDTAVVRVVTFSEFGGFIQRTYTISREYPHKVLEEERKTLVEYDSGVQF